MSGSDDIPQRVAEIEHALKQLDHKRHLLEQEKATLLVQQSSTTNSLMTTEQKLALFQRLFHGRRDVHAQRWENKSGKSGYSVACANEWRPGICRKPKVKCGDCSHRNYKPLDTEALHNHLTGRETLGVYPLLNGDCCWFLAADFDKSDWRAAVAAYRDACDQVDIECAVEISRSGNGAHVWIFFDAPVPAEDARALGFALLDKAMESYPQLDFASYDRLFPNQDTMPAGGFGNLIALPLQKARRAEGCSVFVDHQFVPYPDQWSYLAQVKSFAAITLNTQLSKLGYQRIQPPDFRLSEEVPWDALLPVSDRPIAGCPKQINAVLANAIYLSTGPLPSQLLARLKRLATFANPAFFKTQALRFSTQGVPRHICCAHLEDGYLCLPRGCRDELEVLLGKQSIEVNWTDERQAGVVLPELVFKGELRPDQQHAVNTIRQEDFGILHAPTAFGKTVTAIGLIVERQTNTLILVHSKELVTQWKERLETFLGGAEVGVVYGGKRKPTGQIDVATYQSLLSRGDNTIQPQAFYYGHVVIDECHHLSAPRYEQLLSQIRPRYVTGLTATPERQDGHQPIIFMQAGPIRHRARVDSESVFEQYVFTRQLAGVLPESLQHKDTKPHVTELMRWLSEDDERSRLIIRDVIRATQQKRHCLVLTERKTHAETIKSLLTAEGITTAMLIGGQKAKERRQAKEDLSTAQVIVATGRYIGEGFDLPRLDTLFLALPISWKGTLAQYAGRIHRTCASKTEVHIYDYIDMGHPMFERMFTRRSRGYRAMGYCIEPAESTNSRQETLLL
ncbi:DEAD/DEAH box helicase family protein [Motiliproteus sp. SC1-56]|uniref:TOTE conflict system archaeo-eukaryotic primase domain-containing protein n=1 Tax=Motiliproteus sp. SC1-56 TaxID=2799565 RepID=UPI001A901B9B|nr:DEAD/DEAH box helicase [Motiliproteus sp. SC1-56]